MILFFKAQYVLIGFLIAAALLTVATMYPYLKHRIPEIREETQSPEPMRNMRRSDARAATKRAVDADRPSGAIARKTDETLCQTI